MITLPPLPLAGACQCGAVRYEIRAAPSAVYACHCTDCQTQSGSAFSISMLATRDALATVAGEPAVWRRTMPSGQANDCVFCAVCGTRLYHLPERRPAIAIVKAGTLDDTSWLRPVAHIWTRSAQPWIAFPEDVPSFPMQAPDLALITAAWQRAQEI